MLYMMITHGLVPIIIRQNRTKHSTNRASVKERVTKGMLPSACFLLKASFVSIKKINYRQGKKKKKKVNLQNLHKTLPN